MGELTSIHGAAAALAAVDGSDLRRTFAHFPSGVVAVCARIGGAPYGLVASTFVPVSLDPPLVSICVQYTSQTWPRLEQAGRLGLSLLSSEQEPAARSIGSRRGDRFRNVELHNGNENAAFVGGAAAWLETSVHEQVPAGDHAVVLLRVHRVSVRAESEPMVFHRSGFRAFDGKSAVGQLNSA
ncbi:flavin reductase family protein [Nocardia seriolae]|uniref:flavin reductase family protein n=1 Tax=Nocardia seriolae TaxID=37332 RepID=UPI0006923748|nr:flavin reductase family protein [Nocardia seriolae]MTJ60261.1 oxidoreductase [Nocardia seriolae]MTJ73121.1 oxidoreductase [Nocardia seriolae]MTJ85253.1 oxidoreductase [Nocardia seriolae]MTK29249.1 oxidoreductase [Nocardia seriolae]MTK38191.1 oxidoreductase [Nocardia seriolae]